MKDLIKATGSVRYELRDAQGNIKEIREEKNLVVTAGKTYLATWLAAASQAGAFMSYIGVGTGTTAAQATDTALQTALATRSLGTVSSSTNTWQNTVTFGAGVNTGAITEAGLFSASSAGTMFAHQVFAAINKDTNDTLTVTWTVTFA